MSIKRVSAPVKSCSPPFENRKACGNRHRKRLRGAPSLCLRSLETQGGAFTLKIGLLVLALALFPSCSPRTRIVVGCKNFTEQVILGELIAQQIENKTHLPVERR